MGFQKKVRKVFFSTLSSLITPCSVGVCDRGHARGCSGADLRVTSSDMSRGHGDLVTRIVASRDNKMGGDVIRRREQEQTYPEFISVTQIFTLLDKGLSILIKSGPLSRPSLLYLYPAIDSGDQAWQHVDNTVSCDVGDSPRLPFLCSLSTACW